MNGMHAPKPWTMVRGLSYGALSIPLAFFALPLYVHLPNFYAKEFGLGLGLLGAILLAVRLLDAFLDPLMGRYVDYVYTRHPKIIWSLFAAVSAGAALFFIAIFNPPSDFDQQQLIAWLALFLIAAYLAYSFLSIAYQTWGARLGGDENFRAQVAAWREAPGIFGVLLASSLPVLLGMPTTAAVLVALFAICVSAFKYAPSAQQAPVQNASRAKPWQNKSFVWLTAIFVLSGIASSVPASLVLFFVQDRLQAPAKFEAVFLVVYFLSAALALPLWLSSVKRIGLYWAWLLSMLLSVATFIGAMFLGAGDTAAFLVICALSGLALAADLALPAAILTGVIAKQGDQGSEGKYLGWWNFASKLNLALAAGLALPMLALFGYSPGVRSPEALQALTIAYCVLPCALKCIAACALFISLKKKIWIENE